MAAIQSLGYLRIESADVGAWREFGRRGSAWPRAAGPTRTRCTCGWTTFPPG